LSTEQTMTGISFVSRFVLSAIKNSHPSSAGIITSNAMTVGRVSAMISRASALLVAPMTRQLWPAR